MNRWAHLIGYALLICVTQVLWVTFSPITTGAATAMHAGVGAVGDLTALFPIVYIVVAVPAGIWLDRHFTSALAIGALLTGFAGIARIVLPVSYGWQFVMQMLLAIGQPFVINAVASFARHYFPERRRPIAISISSVALFIGVIVAMIVSPILMHHGGLYTVELGEGIPAVVIMLWVTMGLLGPLRSQPFAATATATAEVAVVAGAAAASPAPSQGAGTRTDTTPARVPVWTSLRIVFASRFVWMLSGLLAVGLGVFDALNTWLQPIFAEYGMGNSSGNLLALMLVAGIIGAGVLPSYAAKHGRRKVLMVIAVGLTTWMFVAIMLWQSVIWIGAWMVLTGFFLLAGFPIIMEWTEHHVQPELQGIAVGFIMLTSHLGGIVLIFVIQFALKPPALALLVLTLASALGLWLTLRLPGSGSAKSTEHTGTSL